ncbi:MAG: tetratricopeptide repeat protein [Spirochaetales bacterium]|jgi:Tfp pilus assembly protein PilF|nr:tetratricopeptide repeat protein [Spirochaetales bacterium]
MKTRLFFNSRGRFRIFPVLLGLLGVLAALGLIFFLSREKIRKQEESYLSLYQTIEDSLSRGIAAGTEDRLTELLGLSQNREQYLGLLRLALGHAELTENYGPFIEAAEAARRKNKEEEFLAFHLYGLLRSGQSAEALLLGRDLKEEPWQSLKAEAILQETRRTPGFSEIPAELGENPYLKALHSPDPEFLRELGERTGETDYLLDAGLLFLGEGRVQQAAALLQSYPRAFPDEYALLLSIDSGQDAAALELLAAMEAFPEEAVPEVSDRGAEGKTLLSLLRGDILIRLGRLQEAREFYQTFVRERPDFLWLPWSNVAALIEEIYRGDPTLIYQRAVGRDYLERGLRYFPGSEELSLALGQSYLRAGDYDRGEEILNDLARNNPSGFEAELTLIRRLGGRRSPAYVKGRYWELFHRFPGEERPARSFAAYLLGWGQWGDLDILLNRYEDSAGAQPWAAEYRGLAAALQGRLQEAEENLAKSLEAGETLNRCYNLGVIQAARGNYRDAGAMLRRAEVHLGPGREENPRLWGRIRILQGIVFFMAGDYEAARRELSYGLSLDPENLRGQSYFEQLP